MTDQTIPADDLRGFIARYRTAANGQGSILLDELEAMLPPPPRPTLADMTPVARRECQWMQCEVNGELRVITLIREGNDHAVTLAPSGFTFHCPPEKVTPRPDLPRLEWPGNKKPAPALPDGWRLADHEDYGRVIVTTQTPDRDGYVYVVIPDAGNFRGYDWHFCDPADLTFFDQEDDTSDAVLPNTLAVGSEWDDVDKLSRACDASGLDQIVVTDKDGDASVWGQNAGWWEGSTPTVGYEPFTILHTGKKADQ